MAPFIVGLIKAGLPMLANAVLSKGKEYIEEKTGLEVDLKAAPTQAELIEYKKLEYAHEAELIRLSQEDNKLAQQDRASAREREARVTESGHASWLQQNIVALLASAIVGGAFIMWGLLVWAVDGTLDGARKEIIIYILGALSSAMMLVLGYYFGTSASSQRNGDALRDILKKREEA